MFSLFSSSASHNREPAQKSIDVQLLSSEELLAVWEQAQLALVMLQERGISSHSPQKYSNLVENELSNRIAINPLLFMQENSEQNFMEEDMEEAFPVNPIFANILTD